jgi:predicted AlkP superfamily phosphohydrolase/phosphomutase
MLGFLRGKFKKRKVAIIGIDGVPCSLLQRFIGEGLMPNFSKLVEKGTLSGMTVSVPEVSSTSWTTFMTGVNPGRHGIYGFMELHKETYKWRFPNSNDIKSETIWEMAGKQNKKSIVLNVPSTYPARPLNGILTAGFVSLDLKKATYPESAYEYLKDLGYKMDVDTRKAFESLGAFAEDIDETFAIRKKAILHFLDNHDWDLFIGVITETDRLHHYLWTALEDSKHPQHDFFINFYKQLDEFIGEVYERVGDDTPFIMLSDHGSTAIKQEIYLNTWLQEKGYLKFKKECPASLEDMNSESSVFVLDPARFYVHLKDKYTRGSVDLCEYENIRNKLREELMSFTIDGYKVIKAVLFKEELYHGEFFQDAPDLVALSHEGYDLKGSINKTLIAGKGMLTGGHTREDAFFYLNRKVKATDINIVDIGPTIISLLNIDGYNFDGQCLI